MLKKTLLLAALALSLSAVAGVRSPDMPPPICFPCPCTTAV